MPVVRVRLSWLVPVLAALIVLGSPSSTPAERRALPAPLQAQVNRAIDRGIVFLFSTQMRSGTWNPNPKDHPVAYAALPGLTLLECGEPSDHPAIRLAAAAVRKGCPRLDATYDLALALLFLDRLGDPGDEELIRTLAIRLIAGQSFSGGWSYRCPLFTDRQTQQLLVALRTPSQTPPALPDAFRFLPMFATPARIAVADLPNRSHDVGVTTDNSNSQFAMLALWAAQRHAVPMERTLARISYRFHTSQNRDGSWGYHFVYGGGDPERAPMTCVGLLGLAIGHGLAADRENRENPAIALQRAQALAVASFHPGLAFVLPILEEAEKKQAWERTRQLGQDVNIVAGFVALNKHVGEPVERVDNIVQRNLYFMWSLERVAVLYDLPTIGDKDWYRWGVEMLLANQKPNGNWDNGDYPSANPVLDTCLALLFLKRANLAADLTTRLPFDPKQLTSSIKAQLSPPGMDADAERARLSALHLVGSAFFKAGEAEAGQEKAPATVDAVSVASEETPTTEEGESRGRNGWLWLMVVVAVVLFIACGILLTSYSLARTDATKRPRWKRHAQRPKPGPHRTTQRSKHS